MLEDRKSVLFVIPALGCGGAERVLINILERIDRRYFKPYLLLLEAKGEFLKKIPEDLHVIELDKRGRLSLLKLAYAISRKVYPSIKPNIVVSFLEYANWTTIVSGLLTRRKPPIIISQRSICSTYLKSKTFARSKIFLTRQLYKRADRIITVSKGVEEDLNSFFGIPYEKMTTIYNFIDTRLIDNLENESTEIPWPEDVSTIIACGRLTYQKNYPLLLNAFSVVQAQCNARLIVIGEGEERTALEAMVTELGLSGKVMFLGFQSNPYKYFARGSVFALSSFSEGFGNVIIEAMACGIPVVSTDCPSGPGEIIQDRVNGILVPVGDKEALSKGILELLTNKTLAGRLIKAGVERAKAFQIEESILQYEQVLMKEIDPSLESYAKKNMDWDEL